MVSVRLLALLVPQPFVARTVMALVVNPFVKLMVALVPPLVNIVVPAWDVQMYDVAPVTAGIV